ncbi:Phage antirepressor [Citrifermentans bremense]|uniref:Phage antirepressor n=1 Tax=Citrifermentans bremense TaxID=60035 RepID=A0A6S6LZ30_9BACT|nr:Rha family transcriptional regulator [Citrifermentans bremense]BCG46833.1 Phage antirepressor [Citrifermentans bremense]
MNEIVTLQHRQAVTSSLTVANVFRKQHKDVIRAIDNLVADLENEGISQRNFAPREYTDERGKTWPMYEMNRDGFSLLAMGFTGKKALGFKLKYIDAFNHMERLLLNQQNLSWQEQRDGNKIGRRAETDALAEFVDYATAQGSQSARFYYANVTNMTYKALNLVKQSGPQSLRDSIDTMQLSFLTSAEYLIRDVMQTGMAAGIQYRDIFQQAKDAVTAYAATLPGQRLLRA